MVISFRLLFLVFWCAIIIFSSDGEVLSLPFLQKKAIAAEAKSDQAADPVDSEKDPFLDGSFEDQEMDQDLFTDIEVDGEELINEDSNNTYLGGFLKEEVAYRLDRNDPSLSKVRSTVNLDAESELGKNWTGRMVLNGYYDVAYSFYGRDRFTTEALDQQESDLELRDTYLEGLLAEKLTVKMGRQIIGWGQSEFVQVTDIVNPRDQTEFAMVDLEDARLPVFATRLTWIPGNWELTLAAVHEVRPNKVGAKGTDFDPYQSLWEAGNIVEDEQIPQSKPENTEFMGRLQRKFNGADLSLVVGDYYDDGAYLDFDSISMTAGGPQVALKPAYKRIQMIGMAGDKVIGDYLLKFDGGYFFDTAVARNDINAQLQNDPTGVSVISWQETDILRTLVGVEYSGIDDLRLTLEGAVEHIPEYSSRLEPDQTAAMFFFLANYQALNQTLDYDFQWGFFPQYEDQIYKLVITYDLMDAVELSLGAIYYQMDDSSSPLYPFREQNRIFGGVKYSF